MSGLINAIQLQRQGKNVTILEQESASERSSYGYGVSYMVTVQAFLKEHDRTGALRSIPSEELHYSLGRYQNLFTGKKKTEVTSWGYLYRILRANFDGFASKACPKPPPAAVGSGIGDYRGGKKVTGLIDGNDKVTLEYIDVLDGKRDTIVADLVIGADGFNSTIRNLVQAPFNSQYAGYVAWRGIIPEYQVSASAAAHFANGMSFDFFRRSYIICYIIPTDDGAFDPGERLLNWVWYFNVHDGSWDMTDIFSDVNGMTHQNTVPRGSIRPEVWDRIRADAVPRLAAPFAEILSKTKEPFVSKINDLICESPRHLGGKVVLVGDAFCTLRPHTGAATEQGAIHCRMMAALRSGEKTANEWERDVWTVSRQSFLASRVVGELGQGTILSFLAALFWYVLFLFTKTPEKKMKERTT